MQPIARFSLLKKIKKTPCMKKNWLFCSQNSIFPLENSMYCRLQALSYLQKKCTNEKPALNPLGKRNLAFSILDLTLLSKTVTLHEYQKKDQNGKAVQCKTGECNFVPLLSSSPGRSTYLLLVAVYCCHDVTLI